MSMRDPKVFGIGFHKTGTKTLAAALRTLGYRVTGPNGATDPDIANNALEMCFSLVGQFDAFQDNPWPVMYKTLDRAYPQSKFVLTVRPTDEWIASVVDYFGREETPMRKWIYGAGSPLGRCCWFPEPRHKSPPFVHTSATHRLRSVVVDTREIHP